MQDAVNHHLGLANASQQRISYQQFPLQLIYIVFTRVIIGDLIYIVRFSMISERTLPMHQDAE
jgi:hypothetical protein